jgi:NADH-quinone oxidoreductase subunit G
MTVSSSSLENDTISTGDVIVQSGVPEEQLVTVVIDGQKVRVRKGLNIIEAAKLLGKEIPHYCYHPDLSIAGNCRMCQIQVKGAPRLSIGCNTTAQDGLEISTQATDPKVADAQASVLEFILANHPLDCTVCDQAGHCKLQDYHYEYSARSSRFSEDKVHKVKAEPLGPTVMLDGERCIMCSRCVRFCDEVTGTSEIGLLNRGDRTVIAVNQDRPLDNPLSGTVVDLCPVGALTHRNWRFNSRIWFSKQTDSICPGCSTGCNVRVAVRDKYEVVQVKARYNSDVNKEWLCDEGRYGFNRFLPKERLAVPLLKGEKTNLATVLSKLPKSSSEDIGVFISPDLTLEEYVVVKRFFDLKFPNALLVVAYRERELSAIEAKLVSPDYAFNIRGAQFAGIVRGEPGERYSGALRRLRSDQFSRVFCIGERSIFDSDLDVETLDAIKRAKQTLYIGTDAKSSIASIAEVVIPSRSILEKSGLMINRSARLQYVDRVVELREGTDPEWRIINEWAKIAGASALNVQSDRDLTLSVLASEENLKGLKISMIKDGGVLLPFMNTSDFASL